MYLVSSSSRLVILSSRHPLVSSSSRKFLTALGLAVLFPTACIATTNPTEANFSIGNVSGGGTLIADSYVHYTVDGFPKPDGPSGGVQAYPPSGSSSATGTSYASLRNNGFSTVTLSLPASVGIHVDGSRALLASHATSTITLTPDDAPQGTNETATATGATDSTHASYGNASGNTSSLGVDTTVFTPGKTWTAHGDVSASATN